MHSYKKGRLNKKKYAIYKMRLAESGKYREEEIPVDPNAKYFVLRIDVDPHARKALEVYRDSVFEDNPEFAEDINRWLLETEREFFYNQE